MKYQNTAKRFAEAVVALANNEDALDNLEYYLSMHFDVWMQKFASTPEKYYRRAEQLCPYLRQQGCKRMNEQKAMKAYKALRAMESAADLKKAGFTLSDYRAAQDCLQEYARNNGEDGTATISEAVAKWYAKQGFDVQPEGIGWNIR